MFVHIFLVLEITDLDFKAALSHRQAKPTETVL